MGGHVGRKDEKDWVKRVKYFKKWKAEDMGWRPEQRSTHYITLQITYKVAHFDRLPSGDVSHLD